MEGLMNKITKKILILFLSITFLILKVSYATSIENNKEETTVGSEIEYKVNFDENIVAADFYLKYDYKNWNL